MASYALLAWGLISMTGYIMGYLGFERLSVVMRGIGAASMASPLPIVFSDVKGFETFSATFWLNVEMKDGSSRREEITPALYARLKGPYNRRNIYGAAISYGPRLPEKVWQSVLGYALCKNGPLAKDFELPGEVRKATVDIRSNTLGRSDTYQLALECP